MTDRQNVLFVVFDQFRADCLFGDLAPHVELPTLRALMKESVSFSNNYTVCAPCGPARASLLTGQYAMNHRSVRNGTPLRHDTPNLATELRKAGRLPLLYGYTDSAQDPRTLPPADPRLTSYEEVMTGFEEVVRQRFEDAGGPWISHLVRKGYKLSRETIFRPVGPEIDDPALYDAADSDTAFLTDATLSDLLLRPPGWVAHLTYIRPHPPFVAPEPYNRMFDKDTMPAPRDTRDNHPFLAPARAYQSMTSVVKGFDNRAEDADAVARIRSVYMGLAAEVDEHLGRVIAFLKQTGQYENTLIVVTSDHGELLGDFGCWGKSHYYDAAFHTPLIIRAPGHEAQAGTIRDEMVESIDITPTILDLLGVDIPDSMDGRSLRPFLEGTCPDDWPDYSYSELDFGNPIKPTRFETELGIGPDEANLAILRERDHTLVQFGAALPPILFDKTAAGEAADVSHTPGAAETILRMTQKMLRHRMQNPDGLFARTMITSEGPKRGTGSPVQPAEAVS
ncbi:sulfatase-like hydrolase/transferase [Ponticoccus sp. SC2-23]|uniref:sulfatase-like hydrolase/transferase n=1 Tax=Alexandriicola marinus TaxID=2081710 RepID=UPI000FD9E2E0|nr:sulfatase-like hydrolase/transferase [Alexandriicola marinus]MBM1219999.1 sulfatase-like hydrolase/transferase [Ponticoccus sp. SC6-9]MBM1224685.1 sulfatase-like hydrolase/transferase [Ponticoccus sp. SC6-15]MBM1228198.1 sulfatase-like hydrolase/transferase [Ponticoccus sp. SC6-38]MBM1234164.1 sulfatase-like hydrolase/transferase [Ponticoccus sp. SC6-45]MBM1238700.1 sulfatase-like hydrolase/transferase [Ponticoccus sp. SC6-49]MBM1242481.1 sulfatase-like hydrolase/transferase [Ponticoccus s